MTDFLATATFENVSGLPEDRFVNTFSFTGIDAQPVDDAANIATALIAFYTDPLTHGSLTGYMGSAVTRAAGSARIKVYNRADPTPRSPLVDIPFTPDVPLAGENLPAEVACVLSFRAAIVSGANMARRRGRVYIGPLNVQSVTSMGNADPRPDTEFMEDLLEAADSLHNDSATAGHDWQVWSSADGVGRDVVFAWVDNAFDTQRRRGPAATTRLSETL